MVQFSWAPACWLALDSLALHILPQPPRRALKFKFGLNLVGHKPFCGEGCDGFAVGGVAGLTLGWHAVSLSGLTR